MGKGAKGKLRSKENFSSLVQDLLSKSKNKRDLTEDEEKMLKDFSPFEREMMKYILLQKDDGKEMEGGEGGRGGKGAGGTVGSCVQEGEGGGGVRDSAGACVEEGEGGGGVRDSARACGEEGEGVGEVGDMAGTCVEEGEEDRGIGGAGVEEGKGGRGDTGACLEEGGRGDRSTARECVDEGEGGRGARGSVENSIYRRREDGGVGDFFSSTQNSHTQKKGCTEQGCHKGWKCVDHHNLMHKVEMLTDGFKRINSELDECKQRLRKGTLIISSQERTKNGKRIPSLFDDMLPKKRPSVSDESSPFSSQQSPEKDTQDLIKILDLVEKEYWVKIPVDHVVACHWIPNGSYIIRVDRRSPSSPWRKIVSAIQSGTKAGNNLFVNFNLTRGRLALLKEVRSLRWNSKIQKFSIDENGCLAIRLNSSDNKNIRGPWIRITQHYNKEGFLVPTKTVQNLLDFIHGK